MGRAAKREAEALRLDFGCGKNTREGFEGVDVLDFGQKHRLDLRKKWPWPDSSVTEAHASHFIEHLNAQERIHFANELYRVLVSGGKCQIITPHWASCRAYGDLTHQWPPVSEFWWYYLDRGWRAVNAPHNDAYSCDFHATWFYNMRPDLIGRNDEYRSHALSNYKEAAQDMIGTIEARK